MAKLKGDYIQAHKAIVEGDLKTCLLHLLAAEITTQSKLDGQGDEAFRRYDIVKFLIPVIQDTELQASGSSLDDIFNT